MFPLSTVKSVSGTATNVAISPPDARLQSVQRQFAMKVGWVSNPYVTVPHAQWPVYFLFMSFPPRQKGVTRSAVGLAATTVVGERAR